MKFLRRQIQKNNIQSVVDKIPYFVSLLVSFTNYNELQKIVIKNYIDKYFTKTFHLITL